MAPHHSWFTSPARSHANAGQGTELPLHLIQLILDHLDNVADLARCTRTSRLFYYMTLPRLYEHVTLRSYADIRYVNGRPEGYGGGTPFAMGLNTLVSRSYTDYMHTFRVVGDWREHDTDDYSRGRVPDNSMMLQVAMRAALDRMKELRHFAWELNTKPMQTIYQSLMTKAHLSTLTLRCQTKRIPRPTTMIPPLPALTTLVVYDIDPLCYPDDISVLLLAAKQLENLKLHWSPRMRDSGEESVNLLNYFGRVVSAKYSMRLKRIALYNLYARNLGHEFENTIDSGTLSEVTMMNSMGSSDPMTIFLDETWRLHGPRKIPQNLKMTRSDFYAKEQVDMFARFSGLERVYFVAKKRSSKTSSAAATPASPSTSAATPTTPYTNGPPTTEQECRTLASDYLAVFQSNHRTLKHLLLSDHWTLSDEALFKLCQSCPDLEQLGFSCGVPPLDSLRQIIALVPKLWAMRILARPGSDMASQLNSMDTDMHVFALATELWKPEYRNLKYVGLGDKVVFRLGGVVMPKKTAEVPQGQENSMNARRMGPMRRLVRVGWEEVRHVEIWGLDSTEFEAGFP
ncbi:hypothetical protein P154DRAFT_556731 [Amniculicola lignicola CBS 123094]|uniref:F-box domain-containing protein n=1 Tax=Amniculicola lignicola CBS 123094 TaxID=1392246 RepID=A0A6A5W622_9PLEO|nr:hypothetical protein P154DRAFT_556731 [Amniculicola lignicola CBS 123094]